MLPWYCHHPALRTWDAQNRVLGVRTWLRTRGRLTVSEWQVHCFAGRKLEFKSSDEVGILFSVEASRLARLT